MLVTETPVQRAAYAQVILQINKWQLMVLQLDGISTMSKLTKTQDGIMNNDNTHIKKEYCFESFVNTYEPSTP